MTTIDFKAGRITYNEFHVNFNLPFSEQEDCLTEDLLQVEYENGYLIDLGWYPEYDETGKFILQLINNGNWKNPIYKKQSRDWEQLKKSLIKAIDMANTGIN